MDLCNRNDIQALLQRHGFHFSKAMGQNFLIQGWVPGTLPPPAARTSTPACWRSAPASAP